MKDKSFRTAATLLLLFVLSCPAMQAEGLKSHLERSARMKQPMFKGVELYSWKLDGKPVWTMLIGTNRNKSDKEIRNQKEAIKSMPEMEKLLGKLAPGEYAIIVEGRSPISEDAPPADVAAIKDLCKKFGLNCSP